MAAAAPPAPGREAYAGTTLRLDWHRRHVALVTFTRPEECNALSVDTAFDLRQVFELLSRERPAALVLTGTGTAFCAGANLKMIASPDAEFFRDPMAFRDKFLAPLAQLFDSFEEQPYPIIAAINGYALGGGCEMALSADFRLMAHEATLGLPEVGIGAFPGAGGVQKLIRHVGRTKALEWILLGSRISSEEAMRAGLLFDVVNADQLLARALDLAERFTTVGPNAVAQAKTSIYVSEDADLRTAGPSQDTASAH